MRKIIVVSMITLDGVMQAPGGPEEDTSGGFEYGGWSAPFDDDVSNKVMQKLMQPADLLLGRKTFKIWEGYWPQNEAFWPDINTVTKYVLSTTVRESAWTNCIFIDSIAAIKNLKEQEGSDLQVWGSSELIQLLLKNDMVDELWLIIHPITLGQGKKLFQDGAFPATFTLAETTVSPRGLIIANYKRSGEVATGNSGG